MVKTPKTRHSKAQREPVTIELEPGAVSRVSDAPKKSTDTPTEIFDLESFAKPEDAETDAAAPGEGANSPRREDVLSEPEPVHESEPQPESDAHREAESLSASPEAEKASSAYDFQADDKAKAEPSSRPAQTETMTPDPQILEPKRSRLPVLAAGLIGGAVALAGGGLLQFAGLLGSPGAGNSAPALDGVEVEIAELKAEIATLKDGGPAGDVSGKIDGFAQALDQVKADVASLQQSIAAGGAGENAGLQALDAKIKEIEVVIANLGQQGGAVAPAEIAALNERIAGVEALAKAAGEAGSVVDGRLGALEQSLAALTAKVDAQAAQPKIALAIAAAALKSAVERGVPFQSEIETFAAVVPDAAELAALRAYAEKGVATRADILAETDAAANTIIAAANPPKQDAGFFERLLSSAESLVAVRPIGAVEGPGVPETLARMEVAIQAGDLAKALAEFDTLPEPAKTAGAAFADKIKARLEVEKLVDQAIASAMKA